MLVAWCGIQVVDTLPHLVEPILSQPVTPVEQGLELRWRGIANERRHAFKATAGPALESVSPSADH
jgi:hypothetical protein